MKKAKQEDKKLFITAEQNGFDMLTRNISRNTFLSDGAKALFIYLNSHNENFNLSIQSIATYLNKGIATINREIKELKDNGFLILEKKENNNSYYYRLSNSPKLNQIKDFTNDQIIDAFFKNIIDLKEISLLCKKGYIMPKDCEKILDEIFKIMKESWLDK